MHLHLPNTINTFLKCAALCAVLCLTGTGLGYPEENPDHVGKYQVCEIELIADSAVENPFDVYLLKVEVESPSGQKFQIDGFFDGNGSGGQKGRVWKARICPDEAGVWKWRTVPGDREDGGLLGHEGRFKCVESQEPGGIVSKGKYFRLQEGDYIYLQGNFLDFADGLHSTHTFMSEELSAKDCAAIVKRQKKFHNCNKINIYLANEGDYDGVSVMPWIRTDNGIDMSQLDVGWWSKFDEYIQFFKQTDLFTELWFFADDSGFGHLSQKEKNRLFRYGMARTSAYSHTLYVIALEWQEEWSKLSVRQSGRFLKEHNPWGRLVSVHSTPAFDPEQNPLVSFAKRFMTGGNLAFANEKWIDFIASQAGNRATAEQVNELAVKIHQTQAIPHLSEEFGFLRSKQNPRLRARMWANFCGGAAGGGTGSNIDEFMRFIEQSGIPFEKMKPLNHLIQSGEKDAFCLAEVGHNYLVYSRADAFQLVLEGNDLKGFWYQPAGAESNLKEPFPVQAGTQRFTPPYASEDWVLWITDTIR